MAHLTFIGSETDNKAHGLTVCNQWKSVHILSVICARLKKQDAAIGDRVLKLFNNYQTVVIQAQTERNRSTVQQIQQKSIRDTQRK